MSKNRVLAQESQLKPIDTVRKFVTKSQMEQLKMIFQANRKRNYFG